MGAHRGESSRSADRAHSGSEQSKPNLIKKGASSMKIIRQGALSAITLIAASLLLNSNLASAQDGALENPAKNSTQSGIGMFSGWHCDAENIHIQFADGSEVLAAYGTSRGDTAGICGDSDNGFGLLFNFNLLGTGEHTVVALADGVEFGRRTFNVMRMSTGEFLSGASAQATVSDFPSAGHSVTLQWSQAQQNFNIVAEAIPASGSGDVVQDGVVADQWDTGATGFDQAIDYQACVGDGGEGCPSLGWETVDDEDRGPVLQVTYTGSQFAGIFFEASAPGLDMSAYSSGTLNFDIKVVNAGVNDSGYIIKVDDHNGGTTGDFPVAVAGSGEWETISVSVAELLAAGNLSLAVVKTGIVLFAPFGKTEGVVYRLDNVYWAE